jgi:hypothetical protein
MEGMSYEVNEKSVIGVNIVFHGRNVLGACPMSD